MTESEKRKPLSSKMKTAIWLLVGGVVVAFSPIPIAFFGTAPGHNWMSEGDSQSGGSALWAMLITLPFGFFMGVFGVITLVQALTQPKELSNSSSAGAQTSTTSSSKGLAITLIIFGSLIAIPWVPAIVSLIGAMMVLAGGAMVWSGIRLLKKGKA